MEFLQGAIVPAETLKKVSENREYNKTIIDYYRRFSSNGGSVSFSSDLLRRKAERINGCNSYWYNLFYPNNHIKDFQSTTLCRDKFCSNCKKVKQSSRMAKYIPEIEPYKDKLYHMTLTVPNCNGESLRVIAKLMSVSFRKLIRIIEGTKKIDGLDFERYGYLGAIRSLEVTFQDYNYHPHYHVAIAFDNLSLADDDRTIINKFSYSYGRLTTLFHPIEILIQKIWYLLINNDKVTKKAIDDLELGYTCLIKQFAENDYAELFKYMTKETKEDGKVLTYDNFIALYYGLYLIKQIQGYGIFYRITDEGDLDSLEQIYEEHINHLNKIENPQASYDTPEDMLKDTQNMIISRKSYFKYLNQSLAETDTVIIE